MRALKSHMPVSSLKSVLDSIYKFASSVFLSLFAKFTVRICSSSSFQVNLHVLRSKLGRTPSQSQNSGK